jgi:hypothetical protein
MNRGIGVIDVQKAFAAQSGKLLFLYTILRSFAVAGSEFWLFTMLMTSRLSSVWCSADVLRNCCRASAD